MSSAGSATLRTAFRNNLTRSQNHGASMIGETSAIRLNDIPRTTTPGDITRMIRQYNVENVVDVSLNYKRFSPTGTAYLKVARPEMVRPALNALQKAALFGHLVSPRPSAVTPPAPSARTRGVAGRAEAAQRAIVTGDGLQGGILDTEKCVVLWGLPSKITVDGVRSWIQGYKLGGGQGEIVKLDPPRFPTTSCARLLVRLSSPSEAYRLVRNVHKTWFQPEVWGEDYVVRARVIH